MGGGSLIVELSGRMSYGHGAQAGEPAALDIQRECYEVTSHVYNANLHDTRKRSRGSSRNCEAR